MTSPQSKPSKIMVSLLILVVSTLMCVRVSAAESVPWHLSLVVLGSGGPAAIGRAGSGYLILLDGKPRILVDAGPGTFARLGEIGLNMAQVDTILLTHLHADHTGELPGMVKARAVATRRDITFDVIGPAGHQGKNGEANFPATSRLIDALFGRNGAFEYLNGFAGSIAFQTKDIMQKGEPRVVLNKDGIVISAISGHHADAPAVIFRVDYAGQSMTFSGDIDAAGHDALIRIAKDTDLLVFNSVVLDRPQSPEILYTLHTAPHDIGAIAMRAKAKRLLLSHLNPSIDAQAQEVKNSISENFRGKIEFASDGMRVTP